MSKQLFYLISFVLVLSMAGSTSADLVANWRFDEGSGTTAVDISGNGHNGTINGTPNWVVGMSGSALEFDGDDYVDIDSGVAELGAANYTIAAWVKTTETGVAILSKSNGDTWRSSFILLIQLHQKDRMMGQSNTWVTGVIGSGAV